MNPIPLRRRIMNLFTITIVAVLAICCIISIVRDLTEAHRIYKGHRVYAAATTDTQAERRASRAKELAARRQRFVEILHDDTPPAHINMRAIIEIESAGDPRAVSRAGCRGLCQISRATWDECCRRLGATWPFDRDAFQPSENTIIGNFYMNRRIPEMLEYYGIPDWYATRIGAYNWGIGNLRAAWRRYGDDWIAHAPKETRDYIDKYVAIVSRQKQ